MRVFDFLRVGAGVLAVFFVGGALADQYSEEEEAAARERVREAIVGEQRREVGSGYEEAQARFEAQVRDYLAGIDEGRREEVAARFDALEEVRGECLGAVYSFEFDFDFGYGSYRVSNYVDPCIGAWYRSMDEFFYFEGREESRGVFVAPDAEVFREAVGAVPSYWNRGEEGWEYHEGGSRATYYFLPDGGWIAKTEREHWNTFFPHGRTYGDGDVTYTVSARGNYHQTDNMGMRPGHWQSSGCFPNGLDLVVVVGEVYLPESASAYELLPEGLHEEDGWCFFVLNAYDTGEKGFVLFNRSYVENLYWSGRSVPKTWDVECAMEQIEKYALKDADGGVYRSERKGYSERFEGKDMFFVPYAVAVSDLKDALIIPCGYGEFTPLDAGAVTLFPSGREVAGKLPSQWFVDHRRSDEACVVGESVRGTVVVLSRGESERGRYGVECVAAVGAPVVFNLLAGFDDLSEDKSQKVVFSLETGSVSLVQGISRDDEGVCSEDSGRPEFALRLRVNGVALSDVDLGRDFWVVDCRVRQGQQRLRGVFFAMAPLPVGRYVFEFVDEAGESFGLVDLEVR